MDPDTPLDLTELSAQANVSIRTVRYYIQLGLLPAPDARGPGAHYGPEHLDRLNLIRHLQRQHLPLAEIRRRIETLSPHEVRRLLDQAPTRSPTDAVDYIHSVLSESTSMFARSPAAAAQRADYAPSRPQSIQVRETLNPASRSQWDRITLAPDVELHVRRPLAREQNRQVERLLEAARAIYLENEP